MDMCGISTEGFPKNMLEEVLERILTLEGPPLARKQGGVFAALSMCPLCDLEHV